MGSRGVMGGWLLYPMQCACVIQYSYPCWTRTEGCSPSEVGMESRKCTRWRHPRVGQSATVDDPLSVLSSSD